MLLCAQMLENQAGVIRYAALLLKEDKYQDEILMPLICELRQPETGVSAEEVFKLLETLYNMEDPQERLFLLRRVKETNDIDLFYLIANYDKDQ